MTYFLIDIKLEIIMPLTPKDIELTKISAHIQAREFFPNHYLSGVCQGARKLLEHFEHSKKWTSSEEFESRGKPFLLAYDLDALKQAKLREDRVKEASWAEHNEKQQRLIGALRGLK